MSFLPLITQVCREFGITPEQLRGYSREKKFVKARKRFIWLAYKRGWSSTQTGRVLNRDHSSILYHINKLKQKTDSSRMGNAASSGLGGYYPAGSQVGATGPHANDNDSSHTRESGPSLKNKRKNTGE